MQVKKIIASIFLFLFSFVFFVYVSFPYTILKEALITEVGRATGLKISVKGFGPSLPLGFVAENIQVDLPTGDKGIDLKAVEIDVKLLHLFLGELAAELQLESRNDGVLELKTSAGILDLIQGQILPNGLELESDRFAVGHFFRFGMGVAGDSLKSQPMVADLVSKFNVQGYLSGKMFIRLNSANVSRSEGSVNLQLKKATLLIDQSLGMADQQFEKALVKASFKSGKLTVDKRSGFHTQELKIDLNGSVGIKKKLHASSLNLSLNVKLEKGLKEQYGYVIDNMLGGNGGLLKYQIKGTVSKPNFVTL